MVKKLIRMTEVQAKWLKAEAKRIGKSQTETIRRLMDKAMGNK